MKPLLDALMPYASNIIAIVVSVFTIRYGTRVALWKERRQILWSKELDRFVALEELAGRLVEELASHRAFDPTILGPMLEQYGQSAGRFARYDSVRRVILDLENTAARMFVAKGDHADDTQALRTELHGNLKRLLDACDQITRRGKLSE